MVRFEINGQVAFCIEPGVSAAEGQVYTATAFEKLFEKFKCTEKQA